MPIDLNDIRTFVSVAQAGTLSAAAKELGLPPSTVSRSITRLEQSIGATLCQRSTKGFTLTDAGKQFLVPCRRALLSLRDGRNLLEKHRENPSGLIRIACPSTLARDVLAPVLNHFIEAHPGLRVEIDAYSSELHQEPRGQIDIRFTDEVPRESGQRVRFFPGTACGLFASPGYLHKHGSPDGPLDLPNHRCIGSGLWRLTRDGKEVLPAVEFHIVTRDPDICLQLACKNAGITVLPLWMAKPWRTQVTLERVLPLWRPNPITMCALYTGATTLTPKVKVFLEFFAKYFGTNEDPRLDGHTARDFFIELHLASPG